MIYRLIMWRSKSDQIWSLIYFNDFFFPVGQDMLDWCDFLLLTRKQLFRPPMIINLTASSKVKMKYCEKSVFRFKWKIKKDLSRSSCFVVYIVQRNLNKHCVQHYAVLKRNGQWPVQCTSTWKETILLWQRFLVLFITTKWCWGVKTINFRN